MEGGGGVKDVDCGDGVVCRSRTAGLESAVFVLTVSCGLLHGCGAS